VRTHVRRQTTQLQRKLDRMAGQIGQFGLAAALVSLLGMAVPFTYRTFVVDGAPWDVAFLGDYLHFLIQAITILVRFRACQDWTSYLEMCISTTYA